MQKNPQSPSMGLRGRRIQNDPLHSGQTGDPVAAQPNKIETAEQKGSSISAEVVQETHCMVASESLLWKAEETGYTYPKVTAKTGALPRTGTLHLFFLFFPGCKPTGCYHPCIGWVIFLQFIGLSVSHTYTHPELCFTPLLGVLLPHSS